MKHLGVLIATSCASLFTFNASSSFASGSFAMPERKKLVFAYIKDAPPISFENRNGVPAGYCESLRSYLDERWDIEVLSITYPERFKMLVSKRRDVYFNKIPAIECGPNTINEERNNKLLAFMPKKASFSNPYFTTSTKILINKKSFAQLYKNPGELSIGVQSATTNAVIKNVFPTAHYVTVKNRADAVDRLTTSDVSRRIDAYTGGEALLIELIKENELGDRFLIEPKLYGYTREQYGIVVYNDDDLLHSINNWIDGNGQEAGKLLNNKSLVDSWLENITHSDYFYPIIKLCLLALCALLLTNSIFLFFMYNFMPLRVKKKLLACLRAKPSGHANNAMTNLVRIMLSNRFSSVRKYEILLIVRELGCRPLFNEYVNEGLSKDQAIEKLSRTLSEVEKSDSVLSKILNKWLDEAGSQGLESINNRLIEWFRS